MKKFELTANSKMCLGKKLFQIKALISFGNVEEGDLGGFIEKEDNLSQYGNAWVYGNAEVYDNARVSGDARVSGNAEVSGDARVSGNARVYGNAEVYGDARVYGDAWVYGNAEVYGNARVYGDAEVYGDAWVSGDAEVSGNADYTTIKGFGRNCRNTTFFKSEDDVKVVCGCFYGTLDEFRKKVKETHGDSKYATEYLMIADLMELHFKED